jgi:hypothetical protein
MRQYHVIPKTGTPAVGPLSAEQVVDLYHKSTDASKMLVWWKEQKEWTSINACLSEIRQDVKQAASQPVAAATIPAPTPVAVAPQIPTGHVRVTRAGAVIGDYSEADMAALLRAKVVLPTDSYLAAGMTSPVPVSELLLKMVLAPAAASPMPPMPVRTAAPALPVAMAAPVRRVPGPGDIVCPNPNCGYVGPGQKIARGSTIIGILLLLCWILPGVIYFMFFSGYRTCCPRCQCQVNNDN